MAGNSTARNTSIVVGVVIAALIGLLAFGIGGDEETLLGEPAPQVAGTTTGGDAYNIDDAQGRWVLVNFFATWCPGCVNEHPDLIQFDAWAEETGQAEIVAVVFNDSPERVEDFFLNQGGDWPVIIDPTMAEDFGVTNIPETFLVNPSGRVVLHIEGEVNAQALIDIIEEPA